MNIDDRAARVERGIRTRLTAIYSHMTRECFEQMVHDIAVNEMNGPYYGRMREVAPTPADAPPAIARVTRVRR